MFEGTLEVRTHQGSYRQPRTFNATPQLLDRMLVDVAGRSNVPVIVVEITPRFQLAQTDRHSTSLARKRVCTRTVGSTANRRSHGKL